MKTSDIDTGFYLAGTDIWGPEGHTGFYLMGGEIFHGSLAVGFFLGGEIICQRPDGDTGF